MITVENEVYVSVVSFWKISLKYSLGKLELKGVALENIPTAVKETGFEIIDLAPREASSFHKLPRLHKDPFDRMLIWQTILRKMTLVSGDKEFKKYVKFGLNLLNP